MSPEIGKPVTDRSAAARLTTWTRRGPLWVLSRPRVSRVLLTALFGVATTLALMPVVDGVYLNYFMMLRLPMLPALISTGFGMGVYIMGWRLIVGTVGEQPALERGTVVYFWFGVLMCLTVLALVVHGMVLSLQDG